MPASVWRFVARPALERRFEEFYGSEGDWALLYRESTAFQGSFLLRDFTTPRGYVIVDVWDSRLEQEEFCRLHAERYAQLDAAGAKLRESERHVGWFDNVDDVMAQL